jgi:MSHA biogenesis protein MshN
MSLINKMLQDLDARGTPGADAFPSQIRPVARERAALADRVDGRSVALALGGTAAACAVAAAAWFGWGYYKQTHVATAVVSSPAAAVKAEAPSAKPAQGMSSTITMGPADAAPSQPQPQPQPLPRPAPAAEAPAPAPAPVQLADRFDAPAVKPAHVTVPVTAPAPAPVPKSVAGYEPDSEEARAARQAIMAELQSRMGTGYARPAAPAHESKREAKRRKLAEARALKEARQAKAAGAADSAAPAAGGKDKRAVQGRQESGIQRAEGEYRHALNALQDGRMTEAVAALEQVLKLDPAHEAARQTLVGLLIEAKRSEEAIRHLQTALALDARQPALAMLLARLQIEGGGNGVDTLTRTLPYAGNNADYHAFLAGALQRAQRHREAAEQYQAALRTAPGNGVWWMGLGMSLQAEKRNSEALEAFQRARASGTLSAELQAFVERRLQQLGK